jgi:hypothetical protein
MNTTTTTFRNRNQAADIAGVLVRHYVELGMPEVAVLLQPVARSLWEAVLDAQDDRAIRVSCRVALVALCPYSGADGARSFLSDLWEYLDQRRDRGAPPRSTRS